MRLQRVTMNGCVHALQETDTRGPRRFVSSVSSPACRNRFHTPCRVIPLNRAISAIGRRSVTYQTVNCSVVLILRSIHPHYENVKYSFD